MSEQKLDQVKLVVESGDVFMFHEGVVSIKKRDNKGRDKEEQKEVKGGIDVTELLEDKRISNKRYKVFNL